jgi:RsmE family RNA methyltransferase
VKKLEQNTCLLHVKPMNMILLYKEDFINKSCVILKGRRLDHILKVHRAQSGDTLTIGLHQGLTGTGTITSLDRTHLEMDVSLTVKPPKKLPLTLILALPRPKVLKRVIQSVTALGIKHIYLVNSWRVEKSYWQSPALTDEVIKRNMILGLEQAKDTRMPEIHLKKWFKPFVEDELPEISNNTLKLVAHPKTDKPLPTQVTESVTLAVGPEGGFIDYEIDKLTDAGFSATSLGERILKVETVLPYLVGKLF